MPLTPWESESTFVALYVATGLVEGGEAESLLLVGPPGVGKSRLIQRFQGYPSALSVSDLTVSGLKDIASEQRQVRHLLLPELQRVFAHPMATTLGAVGLLMSLQTRDAGKEAVGPDRSKRVDLGDRQLGLIAALTTDAYHAHSRMMLSTGFLSRFTVIGMDWSLEERRRVLDNIYSRRLDDLLPFSAVLPRQPVRVTGAEKLAGDIKRWIEEDWKREPDPRMAGHLVSLLKATVILRGRGERNEMHKSDLTFLKQFTPYFQAAEFGSVGKIQPLPPLRTYREFMNGKLR